MDLSARMKSEKGQALVEFALILPIALLILCAVIDFGWLFAHELILSSAVRDGARVGITCADDSDFSARVNSCVLNDASICDAASLSITPAVSGGDVIVRANYTLQMLTPMAPLIVGGMTYNIEASCTMKAE